MMKLKQYINKNKQLLIMLFTLIPFLFVYSTAYCNPMLLMTVLPGISNKVIDKVFDVAPYFADKAIAATPYVAYGTGWVVVGSALTLTSIKAAEYSYNWRYLANQTTSNIPVVGWMVSWSASSLQWCYEKLTNTKIEPVEYTYFYPKIATALGHPNLFSSKIELDLSSWAARLTSSGPEIKEVIKEVEVPVIEYRDRENLKEIQQEIRSLRETSQEAGLVAYRPSIVQDDIIQELNKLSININKEGHLYLREIVYTQNPGNDSYTVSCLFKLKFNGQNSAEERLLDPADFATTYPTLNKVFNALCAEAYKDMPNAAERAVALSLHSRKKGVLYEINPYLSVLKTLHNNTFFGDNITSAAATLLCTESTNTNAELTQLITSLEDKVVIEESWLDRQPEVERVVEVQGPKDVVNLVTTAFQQPATLLAMAVCTAVINDFHTVQQAASILLSFLSTPESLELFTTTTVNASFHELQSTYNFSESAAERARLIINEANRLLQIEHTPIDTPLNSAIETSSFITWETIFKATVVIGVVAGGWYLYKHTGDNSVLQAAPSINNFETEILKGIK